MQRFANSFAHFSCCDPRPQGGFSGIRRAWVVLSVMRKICAFTCNEAREELKRVPVVAYEHTLDASEFLVPR